MNFDLHLLTSTEGVCVCVCGTRALIAHQSIQSITHLSVTFDVDFDKEINRMTVLCHVVFMN